MQSLGKGLYTVILNKIMNCYITFNKIHWYSSYDEDELNNYVQCANYKTKDFYWFILDLAPLHGRSIVIHHATIHHSSWWREKNHYTIEIAHVMRLSYYDDEWKSGGSKWRCLTLMVAMFILWSYGVVQPQMWCWVATKFELFPWILFKSPQVS